MGAGRRVGDEMNSVGSADSFIYGLHRCLGIGCAYHHPESMPYACRSKAVFSPGAIYSRYHGTSDREVEKALV